MNDDSKYGINQPTKRNAIYLSIAAAMMIIIVGVCNNARLEIEGKYALVIIIIASLLAIIFIMLYFTRDKFSIRNISSYFRSTITFDTYFVNKGISNKEGDRINHFIFQIGLRPTIPLMDLMYLEYIHHLFQSDIIDKLWLFSTVDLSYPSQNPETFLTFQQNIKKIFGDYMDRIEIISPFDPQLKPIDVNSSEYLEIVKFTGDTDFNRLVRDRYKLQFKGISDFSKHHPKEIRSSSIVGHINQTWVIFQYLLQRKTFETKSLNIGYLIWEAELEKLGMFVKLSQDVPGIVITPILVKTIFSKPGIPIPNYKDAFGVFDEFVNILPFFAKKKEEDSAEINKYIEVMKLILATNYGLKEIDLKLAGVEGKRRFNTLVATRQDKCQPLQSIHKLPSAAYAAINVLHQLRTKYGLDWIPK